MTRSFGYFALVLALASGCTNPGREEREQASAAFRASLMQETADWARTNPPPYRLAQILDLAHARTLKLTEEELATQLAKINRATAFSVFLPNLELSLGREVFHGRGDFPALSPVGFEANRLWANQQSMMLTQSVFTPAAWVMFAETAYGIRIREIVRNRAQEVLDAQIAALFYRAVLAERLVETYHLQVASGEALTNRVSQLTQEGYAREGDRARAVARLAEDSLNLRTAQDQREDARMKLCEVIRLWPLGGTENVESNLFDGASLLAVRSEGLGKLRLEECVWQGLLTRKDLYAGDQTIELRKAQVLEALANFLPNVMLGGGGLNQGLGNAALQGWGGGLIGVWSVFEGFRTVQDYRAARVQREAEFKLQEDRMLAVVTAVAEAYRNLHRCKVQLESATKTRLAAETDYADAERCYAEGEETLSNVLDKLAVKDAATVQYVMSEYSAALAEVALRQAMGIGIFEEIKL